MSTTCIRPQTEGHTVRFLLATLLIGITTISSGSFDSQVKTQLAKKPQNCTHAILYYGSRDLYPVCMPGGGFSKALASN
jgi:hypothetical protein